MLAASACLRPAHMAAMLRACRHAGTKHSQARTTWLLVMMQSTARTAPTHALSACTIQQRRQRYPHAPRGCNSTHKHHHAIAANHQPGSVWTLPGPRAAAESLQTSAGAGTSVRCGPRWGCTPTSIPSMRLPLIRNPTLPRRGHAAIALYAVRCPPCVQQPPPGHTQRHRLEPWTTPWAP